MTTGYDQCADPVPTQPDPGETEPGAGWYDWVILAAFVMFVIFAMIQLATP